MTINEKIILDEGDPDSLEQENILVEQLKLKDQGAWATVNRLYRDRLQTTISKSLSKYNLPSDRLDDIEQKTWFTAFKKINEFTVDRKEGFYHWLCTIQYNYVRNLSREPNPLSIEVETDEGVETFLPSDDTANVEEAIISRETKREIFSAINLVLDDLPAHHREIVLRRIMWKDEPQALAEEYGVKIQTVYQIVTNAKKKIRNYLLAPDLFLRVNNDRMGEEARTWNK